ncbi:hypothetical protein DM46_2140 [Burkholderia mallei]|nr:hypothetical protein DM46_2140 [Burkholderia mallei]
MAGQASRAERPLKTAAGDCRRTRHARRKRRPTIEQDMPARPSAHAAPPVSSPNVAFSTGDGPHAAHRAAAATALRHSGSATAFPTISGRAKFSLLLN